jgi:hypothetical protein
MPVTATGFQSLMLTHQRAKFYARCFKMLMRKRALSPQMKLSNIFIVILCGES